jgi:hypothetical protein
MDNNTIMPPQMRALALKLLGGGALRNAGEQVNAPNRAAELAAQEAAAMGEAPAPAPPATTPYGGPAGQPSPLGPVQNMSPAQAKALADMLRNR